VCGRRAATGGGMATKASSAASGAAYEEQRRKRVLENLKHLEVSALVPLPAPSKRVADQSMDPPLLLLSSLRPCLLSFPIDFRGFLDRSAFVSNRGAWSLCAGFGHIGDVEELAPGCEAA